jgi:iron complex outermembrane receptor protein
VTSTNPPDSSRETFIAYISRLNYNYKGKYYLTVSLVDNGSSHFSKDNRWGLFPAVALAWKINEESFLKYSNLVSDLKLRLGYGITGQKDIGNNYAYINSYLASNSTAQYQFGNQYYTTLRPAAYDPNIKWEQTESYNIGLDFGFLKNRIYGSIDAYRKNTTNLLSFIPAAEGTNFSNYLFTNVGSLWTKGIEFNVNANIIETGRFTWNSNFNITYNKVQITKLNKTNDPTFPGVLVGGIAGGVGSTVQIHSVGYPPYSFYVNKQVYGSNGLPIEGFYADINRDGIINSSDLYRYKSPNPYVFIGFNNTFTYLKWSLYFAMRANLRNYVYNNVKSTLGNYNRMFIYDNNLSNASSNVLVTNFTLPQYLSDYYIENASFLRMDNIRVSYNFGKIIAHTGSLNVSATVQNVFTVTKYSGLDPEIPSGIDNNFYPRPRIYSLSLNLGF